MQDSFDELNQPTIELLSTKNAVEDQSTLGKQMRLLYQRTVQQLPEDGSNNTNSRQQDTYLQDRRWFPSPVLSFRRSVVIGTRILHII